MANPKIVTQFAMPDPSASPLNLTQLFQLANLLVGSTITGGEFLNVIIQNGEPGANNRDKLWVEQDTQGRPVALKIWWSSHWRRVYNGMLGEVRGYTGNPVNDFILPEGIGKIGESYDGWHLCNGRGGTQDLSDHFLIGAHMNKAGGHDMYDEAKGGWITSISNKDDEHTGGVRDFTLSEVNTWRPARPAVIVDKWSADVNARAPDGQLWGQLGNGGLGQNPVTLLEEDEGQLEPQSVSVVPPFIALGWITFVGYSS